MSHVPQKSDFDLLCESPGLRELLELTWRLFKVNLALVAPDGDRAVCYDSSNRDAPLCQALNQMHLGRRLCWECDRQFFRQVLADPKPLRYQCHAGLTEFIVPVIRQGQVIALLQCGQVWDAKPSEEAWRQVSRREAGQGLDPGALAPFFFENRILPPPRQADLLRYLDLVAGFLASTDCPLLRATTTRTQETVGRIMTFIEAHLTEELSLETIARGASVSNRTLSRWFRGETGMTVLDFILKRRVALACHYLLTTDWTCLEIAFAVGFQSVQNFNRTFRMLKSASPRQWRAAVRQSKAGLCSAGLPTQR